MAATRITEWYARAFDLEKKKDFAELEIHCQQWGIAEPQNHIAWYYLGNAFLKAQKFTKAFDAFDRSLQIRPDFAEAWNNLGVVTMINRKGSPVDVFEKAISLNPRYAEAWNNLGVALKDVNPERSLRSYRKAIRLKKDYADPWSNLADIYWRGGNSEAAIDAYLHAIALRRDYSEAWSRLTQICSHLPDVQMCREVLAELQMIDPIRSESFARQVLPS